MSKCLFSLTKKIAVIITAIISIRIVKQEEYMRFLMMLIMLGLFVCATNLYEKKQKIYSTGYLYLFIIIFLNFNIYPYYYTNVILTGTDKLKYGMAGDYFNLYFSITLIVMCISIGYLKMIRKTISDKQIKLDIKASYIKEVNILLASLFIFVPAVLAGKSMFLLFYTASFTYFITELILRKFKLNIYLFIGIILSTIIASRFYLTRYIVIAYVFPNILIYIVILSLKYPQYSKAKFWILISGSLFCIALYGVISEVVKLNTFYSMNYNLLGILSNLSTYTIFFNRQIYRLFGIWSRLAGNIIWHTRQNGYFFGLTYIKSFARFLGFRYISLPLISAQYIGALYAQPGLLAEGYANFGIIGSVVSLLIPFFFAEYAFRRFMRKKDMFSLIVLTVPFTKILLDGGSINSLIYEVAICIATFSIDILYRGWKTF